MAKVFVSDATQHNNTIMIFSDNNSNNNSVTKKTKTKTNHGSQPIPHYMVIKCLLVHRKYVYCFLGISYSFAYDKVHMRGPECALPSSVLF